MPDNRGNDRHDGAKGETASVPSVTGAEISVETLTFQPPMDPQKCHVWCTAQGAIVAVGYPFRAADPSAKIIAVAADGQHVVELEIAEDLLPTIHLTHRIDIKRSLLVPNSDERLAGLGEGGERGSAAE